jgi:tetratricopeptide (TPR) repeat protein
MDGGGPKVEADRNGIAVGRDVKGDINQTNIGTYIDQRRLPAVDQPSPIYWQGHWVDASVTRLGVAPLPHDRRIAFAAYVKRDNDDELRKAIKSEPFLVVRGPSLAGKTRALYEAARALLPDATVVIPDPDCAGCFARLDAALPEGEMVIWLDDIDRYLRSTGTRLASGLTYDQLEAWLEPGRGIHVLATIRVDAWNGVSRAGKESADPAASAGRRQTQRPDKADRTGWDILQRASLVKLPGPASERERDAAVATFGASVPEGLSIGEFLYSIPRLLDVLDTASTAERAVVWAASDWRRMSGGQTVERDCLLALWRAWVRESPDEPVLDTAFDDGLEFALGTHPDSSVGFMRQVDQDAYAASDYFVAYREGAVPEAEAFDIPDAVWGAAIECGGADALVEIGSRARSTERSALAYQAWERAFGMVGDDAVRASAGFLLTLERTFDNDLSGAIVSGERLWTAFGTTADPEIQSSVARGLVSLAIAYASADRLGDAVAAVERLVATFGETTEPGIRENVAGGLMNLAGAYGNSGDLDNAVATRDRLVELFGAASEAGIRTSIARSLANLATAYSDHGRRDEAIRTGERLWTDFGEATEPDIREAIAGGLEDLAADYANSDRFAESIATGERLWEVFGEGTEPSVRASVANGLVNLITAYARTGDLVGAVAATDRLVTMVGDDVEPGLRTAVARGLMSLTTAHADAGMFPDAIADVDRVLALFGGATEPKIEAAVASALGNLAAAYAEAGRAADAIATGERLIAMFSGATEPDIRLTTARALHNLALAYASAERPDDAIATGERLVAMFGKATEPHVRMLVAMDLLDLAAAYQSTDRADDAIAAAEQLWTQFGGATEPEIQVAVVVSQDNLVVDYGNAGRASDAIAIGERVLERFRDPTDPMIRSSVARTMYNLAANYLDVGRSDDSSATLQRLIATFGDATEPDIHDVVGMAQQAFESPAPQPPSS